MAQFDFRHPMIAAWLFLAGAVVEAQVIFTDDFTSGPSASWGNEFGGWTASGGVYYATAPNNSPPTYSSLPYVLGDFTVTVTINQLSDGGIWLRSADNANGIVLVTGGNVRTGTGLYWHEMVGGNPGPALNAVNGLFVNGVSTAEIRVDVVGNTFSAYVDGSTLPATVLTSSLFASGRVALYSFSAQTFDSFSLSQIPEPSTLALLAGGLGVLAARRWRSQRPSDTRQTFRVN